MTADSIADAYDWLETLWHRLHAKPGECWSDNPWVWVIGFERTEVDDGADD